MQWYRLGPEQPGGWRRLIPLLNGFVKSPDNPEPLGYTRRELVRMQRVATLRAELDRPVKTPEP